MAITNLTNTTWEFIYELRQFTENIIINVDFTSNGSAYNKIMFEPGTGLMFFDSNNNNSNVYTILDDVGTWANEAYRTIKITGGDDITNSTAITNLETLATLISDGTEDKNSDYEVVYNDNVIGTIKRGQKITLKCFSMRMLSNVIIRPKQEEENNFFYVLDIPTNKAFTFAHISNSWNDYNGTYDVDGSAYIDIYNNSIPRLNYNGTISYIHTVNSLDNYAYTNESSIQFGDMFYASLS